MNFYFASFADFIQMGAHGPYVWSCYFLMLVVLLILGLYPNVHLSQLKKTARSRKSSVKPSPTESGSDNASAT